MTREQVRRWLERNPDFFQHHPEILLNGVEKGRVIPMELGELAYLRKERKHLHNQIQTILDRARQNEEIHRAFHTIMVQMISASDLEGLIRGVTGNLEVAFNLRRVTVTVCPARMGAVEVGPVLQERLLLLDEETMQGTFSQKSRAVIRIGQEGYNRQRFFGENCLHIRSEVLIPVGHAALPGFSGAIGSLNLGADKPSRFLPSQSTDLLQDLADILAICLLKMIPNRS